MKNPVRVYNVSKKPVFQEVRGGDICDFYVQDKLFA